MCACIQLTCIYMHNLHMHSHPYAYSHSYSYIAYLCIHSTTICTHTLMHTHHAICMHIPSEPTELSIVIHCTMRPAACWQLLLLKDSVFLFVPKFGLIRRVFVPCVPLPSTDSLLHSKPTMLELLGHVVLRVAARWYHFGLALGVEDYLLEDIKATERGEVEACCTDMLKRWLRGERATGGKKHIRSWSTVLGAVQKCLGQEAASSIAGALQSAQ